MASAVWGTITDPSTNQNSRFLPRNENFAKPYPAMAASSAAPPALMIEYIAVLRIQVQKTPPSLLNVSLMFWLRWNPRNHRPNESNRSLSDLVDEMNSQNSGIRK